MQHFAAKLEMIAGPRAAPQLASLPGDNFDPEIIKLETAAWCVCHTYHRQVRGLRVPRADPIVINIRAARK
jgi:hypothetical protein